MLAYSESTITWSIQMPDLPTPHNPRDPARAVQEMLRGTHGRSALAPLRVPNEKRFWDAVVVDGVYGETFG
jgi:hypothetical protein